jgi:hypothetical protein
MQQCKAVFVTVVQIRVWQQSAHTEELLTLASNHDWCPQIRVRRASVSPALHQKRSHSNFSKLCGYVKWIELKSATEFNVSSGLNKLSTNSDVPIVSSDDQRREQVTSTDSRQAHVCAVAEQHCDTLGRTMQGRGYQQRLPSSFSDAVDVYTILLDERSKQVGALRYTGVVRMQAAL